MSSIFLPGTTTEEEEEDDDNVRVIVSNHNTILHIEYACVTIGKY